MSDNEYKVWGDNALDVSPAALDKMNVRFLTDHIKQQLLDATEPQKDDAGEEWWPVWTPDTWKQHIELRFDYLVDRQAISKYTFTSDVVDGRPSADIYFMPAKTAENIKIEVIVEKDGAFVDFLKEKS